MSEVPDRPILGLEPGLHYDVDEKDYHQDTLCTMPTLSRTCGMILVDECPQKAWCGHPRLGNVTEEDENDGMTLGSLGHKLLLGRGAKIATIDEKDWRKKEARAFRDEQLAIGNLPVLLSMYHRAVAMQAMAEKRLQTLGLWEDFSAAKSEVVALWDDCGVRCRAMFDKLLIDEERKKIRVFDLKITGSANPAALGKHIYNMGYYVQEAFYKQGLQRLLPEYAGRIEFVFCFLENQHPFPLTPVVTNGEFQTLGLSVYGRMIDQWKKCTETKRWPVYTTEILKMEPPKFALAEELGAKSFL